LVRAGVCRCVVAVYSQGAESGGRAIRVESIGDVVKAGIFVRRRNVDDTSHRMSMSLHECYLSVYLVK